MEDQQLKRCSSRAVGLTLARHIPHLSPTSALPHGRGWQALPRDLDVFGARRHQSLVVANFWQRREDLRYAAPPIKAPLDGRPIPKPTSAAATDVTYDFDTNPVLQDCYRSPWGKVRMGRIFEDLDAMAGTIAFEHCQPFSDELHIVTASVDRLTVHERPDINKKMQMRGRVVWTGRSSMVIEMTASEPGSDEVMLQAGFTFVARDRASGKARAINPLVPATPKDLAVFRRHESRLLRRRARRATRTTTFEQEVHERASALLADAMTAAGPPLLPSITMLSETVQENNFVCQPQHRNTSGRIFGGFLIRRAFELAHSTAYCFCHAMPSFVEVDEVLFLSPVEIGNLIHLESCVLYSDSDDSDGKGLMHVEVMAKVMDVEREESAVSNIFHFTFKTTGERPLRTVLPRTLHEARRIAARQIAEREQDEDEVAETAAKQADDTWDPYR